MSACRATTTGRHARSSRIASRPSGAAAAPGDPGQSTTRSIRPLCSSRSITPPIVARSKPIVAARLAWSMPGLLGHCVQRGELHGREFDSCSFGLSLKDLCRLLMEPPNQVAGHSWFCPSAPPFVVHSSTTSQRDTGSLTLTIVICIHIISMRYRNRSVRISGGSPMQFHVDGFRAWRSGYRLTRHPAAGSRAIRCLRPWTC